MFEAWQVSKPTPEPHQQTCPSCGYCPHCGRGGHHMAPFVPMPYPTWPEWPHYPQITWCGDARTIASANVDLSNVAQWSSSGTMYTVQASGQ